MKNILPEMFKVAVEDKLNIEVEKISLKEIESNWRKESGKALVVIM